jgi:hypothetical protein
MLCFALRPCKCSLVKHPCTCILYIVNQSRDAVLRLFVSAGLQNLRLSVVMGLRRGLSVIRGVRRSLTEDEQHKLVTRLSTILSGTIGRSRRARGRQTRSEPDQAVRQQRGRRKRGLVSEQLGHRPQPAGDTGWATLNLARPGATTEWRSDRGERRRAIKRPCSQGSFRFHSSCIDGRRPTGDLPSYQSSERPLSTLRQIWNLGGKLK